MLRKVSGALTILRESSSLPSRSRTATCERLRWRSIPTYTIAGPPSVPTSMTPTAYRRGRGSARRPAPSWHQVGTLARAAVAVLVSAGGARRLLVDAVVSADMRGLGPHDRVCELGSGAAL